MYITDDTYHLQHGPSLGMYRSDGDLIFILIDIIYYILSLSSLFKVKVKKMYITDDTYHLQHGPSLGMYRSDGRV